MSATTSAYSEGVALGVPGGLDGLLGVPAFLFLALSAYSVFVRRGAVVSVFVALLLSGTMALVGFASLNSVLGFALLAATPWAAVVFLVVALFGTSTDQRQPLEVAGSLESPLLVANHASRAQVELACVQLLESAGYTVNRAGANRWKVEHCTSSVITHIRSLEALNEYANTESRHEMPNPSIEGTLSGLRPPSAPHVKR